MKSDNEIDRLLREEAEHWRQHLRADPDIDVRQLSIDSTRMGIGRGAITVGTLGVAAAILALAGFRLAADERTSGVESERPRATAIAQDDIDDLVVRVGDEVLATGTLGASAGNAYLCPDQMLAITGGFGCLGAELVPLYGVDAESWDGKYAIIEGIWDGEGVQVSSIAPSEQPAPTSRLPIPCDAPNGGWPGTEPEDAAEEAARQLELEVERHPERYIGWWPAGSTDGTGDRQRAIVVGTVEDVQAETQRLAAIYPYNLCVVPVEFSATDLQSVVRALEATDSRWHVGIEAHLGRVLVTTTVLDPMGAQAISGFLSEVELRVAIRPSPPGASVP